MSERVLPQLLIVLSLLIAYMGGMLHGAGFLVGDDSSVFLGYLIFFFAGALMIAGLVML